MSDSEEEQEVFESTGADASLTKPIRAGEVKKGKIVLLKGFPCKVIEMTTSKTGKHGHAKANITGIDIFTGKKYEEISPTSHNMEEPVVSTSVFMLTDVSEDGFATLMNEDSGETREDLMVPDQDSPNPELGEQIRKALADSKDVHVTVTKSMKTECITSFRTA
jgi:translation initiation factor 5A